MSRGNERLDHSEHNVDTHEALRTSNLTSGHFLGTVPREWMMNSRSEFMAGTGSQGLVQDGLQRTNTLVANTSTPKDVRYSFTSSLLPEAPARAQTGSATNPDRVEIIDSSDGLRQSNVGRQWLPDAPVISPDSAACQQTSLPATNQGVASEPMTLPVSAANFQGLRNSALGGSSTSMGIGLVGRALDPQGAHYDASGVFSARNIAYTEPAQNSGVPVYTPSSFELPSDAAPATPTGLVSNLSPPHYRGRPPKRKHETGPNSPEVSTSRQVATANYAAPPPPVVPVRGWLLKTFNERMSIIKDLNPADPVRVTGLGSACKIGDMPFIVMHQLSCLHTSNSGWLRVSLSLSPVHIESLDIMSSILGDNRKLSIPVLVLFCNFPISPTGLPLNPQYKSEIFRAKELLPSFASGWRNLKNTVLARRVPPCAPEVVEVTIWYSPILSQAIFSSFFCMLFPHTPKLLSQKAMNLFLRSQESYYANIRGGHAGVSPALVRDRYVREFSREFQELVTSHQQHNSRDFRQLPSDSGHGSLPSPAMSPSQSVSPTALHISAGSGNMIGRPPVSIPNAPQNARTDVLTTAAAPNFVQPRTNISSAVSMTSPSPIFPNPGQIPRSMVNPDSNRCALHQAHLSKHVFDPSILPLKKEQTRRLYAFLEQFLDRPKLIDKDTVFETWSVSVSPELSKRKVGDCPATKDNPLGGPARAVSHKSVAFHLRCIQVTSNPWDEAEVSAAPTFWPEHLFVSINGFHLEFRRKVLHTRDLPVDVSDFLIEGSNEFKLSYHVNNREVDKSFAIVLETITFWEHQYALELPETVPTADSLSAITKSLRIENHEDDDDLVMADAHVSIDLIDPFTARMFERPVRGRTCRHRECFDLEAFLKSRSCRHKDNVVQPDEWKCPLCGKDARPSSLVEDAFLLEVKAKLQAEKKGDVKAILVKSDNTWESKVENVSSSTNKTHTTRQGAKSRSASVANNTNSMSNMNNASNANNANNGKVQTPGEQTPVEQTPGIAVTEPEVVDLAGDSD